MVDAQRRPWILEVNARPWLGTKFPVLGDLVPVVLRGAVALVATPRTLGGPALARLVRDGIAICRAHAARGAPPMADAPKPPHGPVA